MRIRWLGVLVAALALIVSACGEAQPAVDAGESGERENPAPTAPTAPTVKTVASIDPAYVAAVATASAPMQEAIGGVGQALSQNWPTRERLFEVLAEAKLTTVSGAYVEAIGAIQPPDDQTESHDRLRARADALDAVAQRLDVSIASRDLVGVALSGADAGQIALGSAANLPPELCKVVESLAAGRGFCAVEDVGADAAYAQAAHAVAQRMAADFGARAGSLLTAMTPTETLKLLELIQPPIEVALKDARDAFGALEPPARFEADHARLLRFVDETLALAREITAAVSADDGASLNGLFARSGTVANTAQTDFTAAFHPLVAPIFDFDAASR